MKILIISHQHQVGKSTVAEMICQVNGMTYSDSSIAALDIFLFDVLASKYGLKYKTKLDAYNDRVNHREKWYNEIREYNKEDKTRLAKDILSRYDIYVGMRDRQEVEECINQGVFDMIIAVIDPQKIKEPIASNTVDVYKYADIIINNNGSIGELHNKVKNMLHIGIY